MKIAAVCCTYLRPKLLGHMVRCFELQDYPNRELIVLDDAGQYGPRIRGDKWRVHSTRSRYATLGEKRNAAASLVSDDVEAIAVWDDDDLYLPWALTASVAALEEAVWSRPSVVLHPQEDGSLAQHQTGGLFHGGWAYRRDMFEQVGGYPAMNNGEDRALAGRLRRAGASVHDPMLLGWKPFYVYSWQHGTGWHLSGMGGDGYRQLGTLQCKPTELEIADPRSVDLGNPQIVPGIRPRMF